MRRQSVRSGERVQISRVDFAVDPGLQAERARIGRIEGAMTDTMNHMLAARQLADEMAADESVRAGNPHGHNVTLRADDWLVSTFRSSLSQVPLHQLVRGQFPDDGGRITRHDGIRLERPW